MRNVNQAPLPDESPEPLVEILDAGDMPLCVLPFGDARRQFLKHRQVVVLAYDAEGHFFLRKRGERESYAGRFDVSVLGPVVVGEAGKDTAERLLASIFDSLPRRFDYVGEVGNVPGMQQVGVEMYAAKFAQPGEHVFFNSDNGLFTDASELESLYNGYREMLTPTLIHFVEGHLIFKAGGKEGSEESFSE